MNGFSKAVKIIPQHKTVFDYNSSFAPSFVAELKSGIHIALQGNYRTGAPISWIFASLR